MAFSLFINFDGNCRKAVEFYTEVFQTEKPVFMTYGEAPTGDAAPEDKDRIMYTELLIGGVYVMFMDFPSNMQLKKGNSMQPTFTAKDKEEVSRIFNALKEGGAVGMELQQTFWSGLYGMVTDQFGVQWHIMQATEQPAG